jgi:hypothetical protein
MRGQFRLPGATPPKWKPWYERDGGVRLARDREIVAANYPNLIYRIDEKAKRVHLEGYIILRSECGLPAKVQVRVEFPDSYPQEEPLAYGASDRFPHIPDRHFLPDGKCCLWLQPQSQWDAEAPESLLQFLDQVAVFLDQQLVFDALGGKFWPGNEYGHGIFG